MNVNVQIIIKDNKLIKKNPETRLDSSEKNVKLEFIFDEVQCEKYYALLDSPSGTYRALLKETSIEKWYDCEIPEHIFDYSYLKVYLYGVTVKERKWKTNTLIFPISHKHHHHKPHNPKPHHKPHKCEPHHKPHHKPHKCEPGCKHPDFFEYILHLLKDTVNKIVIKEEEHKAYTYHIDGKKEKLIQIIPLPEWVTKEDLSDYAEKSELLELASRITTLEENSLGIIVLGSGEDLPPVGDGNKLYFVESNDPEVENGYDEYVWIDGSYELIGTSKIDINLSGYVRKDELSTHISAEIVDSGEDIGDLNLIFNY